VEVTLAGTLGGHARLLEQVDERVGARDLTAGVELQLDELTETRRVVVLGRLGVTEGLEDRVELEQLLLQQTALSATGDGRQVLDDLLRVLRLTSSRLTTVGLIKK
jgi:hypothetical protein